MASCTESLLEFLRALRESGLVIGVPEARDALEAMEVLDLRDRAGLKAGLRALLAKSPEEQAVFDSHFDEHFVSLAQAHHRQVARQQAEARRRRQLEEAERELTYDQQPIPIRQELKDVYIQLDQQEKERLQRYINAFSENTKRMPSLYRNYIRHMLEQQLMLEDAALGVQAAEGEDLLRRDISRFREEDIPRAIDLITQLTRKLSRQVDRRRKKRSSHGTLDFKRTIGDGLRTGGTFLRLRYRRRPPQRRRLLLLCDVSGSMLQFSEFALRFVQSMQVHAQNCRTFLFSEGLAEMTPHQTADPDRFREHVEASGLLGRGTDLGGALGALLDLRPPATGSNTLLLIVSDGKTVDPAGAAALLAQARRQLNQIIWLNPIPESQWAISPGITALAQHCRMLCCGTLEQLAAACQDAFSQ